MPSVMAIFVQTSYMSWQHLSISAITQLLQTQFWPNFGALDCLDNKFFPTKFFFDQNFFGPKIFFKSFQAEHFRLKSCLNLFFRLPDTLQKLQINLLILDWMPLKQKVPNNKWEEHKMCCNLQFKIVQIITIVPLKLKTGHNYFLIKLASWNKYFTWE